jgi:hypothetical protein
MNELTVVDKSNEWQLMKSLVLDSVSSPITKRVYNMALDEFFRWYAQEPRAGFTKATVSAWRVTLEERGLGSSSIMPGRRSPLSGGGVRVDRTRAGGSGYSSYFVAPSESVLGETIFVQSPRSLGPRLLLEHFRHHRSGRYLPGAVTLTDSGCHALYRCRRGPQ